MLNVEYRGDHRPRGIRGQVPTEVHNVFSRSIGDKVDAQLLLSTGRKVLLKYRGKCCERDLLVRTFDAADGADLN